MHVVDLIKTLLNIGTVRLIMQYVHFDNTIELKMFLKVILISYRSTLDRFMLQINHEYLLFTPTIEEFISTIWSHADSMTLHNYEQSFTYEQIPNHFWDSNEYSNLSLLSTGQLQCILSHRLEEPSLGFPRSFMLDYLTNQKTLKSEIIIYLQNKDERFDDHYICDHTFTNDRVLQSNISTLITIANSL